MVTGVKVYRNASTGVAEDITMDLDMLWGGNQVHLQRLSIYLFDCLLQHQ